VARDRPDPDRPTADHLVSDLHAPRLDPRRRHLVVADPPETTAVQAVLLPVHRTETVTAIVTLTDLMIVAIRQEIAVDRHPVTLMGHQRDRTAKIEIVETDHLLHPDETAVIPRAISLGTRKG